MLADYVDTFERYDVDRLVTLLHHDATLSMPPHSLWLRGDTEIGRWWRREGATCRGSTLIAIDANGSPAFAQYRSRPGLPTRRLRDPRPRSGWWADPCARLLPRHWTVHQLRAAGPARSVAADLTGVDRQHDVDGHELSTVRSGLQRDVVRSPDDVALSRMSQPSRVLEVVRRVLIWLALPNCSHGSGRGDALGGRLRAGLAGRRPGRGRRAVHRARQLPAVAVRGRRGRARGDRAFWLDDEGEVVHGPRRAGRCRRRRRRGPCRGRLRRPGLARNTATSGCCGSPRTAASTTSRSGPMARQGIQRRLGLMADRERSRAVRARLSQWLSPASRPPPATRGRRRRSHRWRCCRTAGCSSPASSPSSPCSRRSSPAAGWPTS